MSVKRARREIDSDEFGRWLAYGEIEPFGPLRDDLRAGMVAAIIANVNRDPRRRPEPFTPATFFDSLAALEPEPDLPDDERLEAKLLAWAAASRPTATPVPSRRIPQPRVR